MKRFVHNSLRERILATALCAALALTVFTLTLFASAPSRAAASGAASGAAAISVEIVATEDTSVKYGGRNTVVVEWRMVANKGALTLDNAQGLRLAYDNSVLQAARWDASAVISDASVGVLFNSVSRVGNVGVYGDVARVYIAKSGVRLGFLSVSLGTFESEYACERGEVISLARVRFAFREGKSVADLMSGSIRCMSVSELDQTAQSTAIMINTNENGLTTYEYLRQTGGLARGGDTLGAPSIVLPAGAGEKPGEGATSPGDPGGDQNSGDPSVGNPSGGGSQSGDDLSGAGQDGGGNPSGGNPTAGGAVGGNPTTGGNPSGSGDLGGQTQGAGSGQGGSLTGGLGVPGGSNAAPDAEGYANPFTDVRDGDWFYNAVRHVNRAGIMRGVSESLFSPEENMTRAMFATVLHRLAGSPAVVEAAGSGADSGSASGSAAAAFSDVPAGQWYSDAISWASERGIVSGYGGSLFGPDDNITREQVVTILKRYCDATSFVVAGAGAGAETDGASAAGSSAVVAVDLSRFVDAGQISSWALEPMRWAVGARVISGRSASELAPLGLTTRSEVAQLLLNAGF